MLPQHSFIQYCMHQLRQLWVRSFMLSLERANLVDQERASNPMAPMGGRQTLLYVQRNLRHSGGAGAQ